MADRDLIAEMSRELDLTHARIAELEEWQEQRLVQARRAVMDLDRFRRIFDPEQPDLAIVIDAVLDERDALRARVAELESVERIGFITGSRVNGKWCIAFDGDPFTREEAIEDLYEAAAEAPDAEWHILQVLVADELPEVDRA